MFDGPVADHLLQILAALRDTNYRFTAVTPATHARILRRDGGREARDLRDVFGWSRPFRRDTLPAAMLAMLERAGRLERLPGEMLKSGIRVSSLDDLLLIHSAYPTDDAHSVFFGPDTYRFARFIASELEDAPPPRRIVDIGGGTGAGALVAARRFPEARVTVTDINPDALRLAAVNAAHAGAAIETVLGSGLEGVEGALDLILANPPFIMDAEARAYRHGGGMHGAELSLQWALSAAERLAPGGRFLLYTGVAIVDGEDGLRAALEARLPALGCTIRYAELDPDIFGEELDEPAYADVERIAAVGAVITRPS
ncbi:methyltransferase domain-containing protein [Sphingomonas parva]|uniref:Methyltransferase domain-containing protein n=1 Tax=Sphingomonas parva TaxID=2555898 RepID=A0A4Y8ZP93_9SPHN|nr:methyltransferase [Sphingomonas parva]TFI57830.1 methyltransferase domain-containing protein [Sphingomonas parva]